MSKKRNTDIGRGDKVTVFSLDTKKDDQYRSIIDDVTPDGLLVMQLPTYRGRALRLRRGDELELRHTRANGKLITKVRTRDLYIDNGVYMLTVEIIAEPVRKQDREFYRLPVNLKVNLYELVGDIIPMHFDAEEAARTIPATAKDLSASGILLQVSEQLDIGVKFVVELFLDGADKQPLYVGGEVVRIQTDAAGKHYFVGFHFLEDDSKRDLINKYVIKEQYKVIKWQRALEND